MVSFEQFKELNIRIGTVLSVEVVEGADKLLKLSVDLGEEGPRTIVSGIREYFPEPEVLVGKQVPVLANLESRVIRGIESQGMILAVGAEDEFVLLTPDQHVPSGSEVR